MIAEKKKKLLEEAGDNTDQLEDPPSPTRHELWLSARQKKTGVYTNEATSEVAKKIVSQFCLFIDW